MADSLEGAIKAAVAEALRAELPRLLREALAMTQPQAPGAAELLGPREIARALGCSVTKARQHLRPQGLLGALAVTLPSGGAKGERSRRRIARRDLEAWARQQRGAEQ